MLGGSWREAFSRRKTHLHVLPPRDEMATRSRPTRCAHSQVLHRECYHRTLRWLYALSERCCRHRYVPSRKKVRSSGQGGRETCESVQTQRLPMATLAVATARSRGRRVVAHAPILRRMTRPNALLARRRFRCASWLKSPLDALKRLEEDLSLGTMSSLLGTDAGPG